MNSKQYVIFLLVLIFLSVVWSSSSYTGEIEDDWHMIDEEGANASASVPVQNSTSTDAANAEHEKEPDHEPEPKPDQSEEHHEQEYHDRPQETLIDHVTTHDRADLKTRLVYNQRLCKAIIGIGSTTATAALAVLVIDRLVERSAINHILAKYDTSLRDLSADDAQLMQLAYRHDDHRLQKLIDAMIADQTKAIFNSAERLWVAQAMSELYFRAEPTQEIIAHFIERIESL